MSFWCVSEHRGTLLGWLEQLFGGFALLMDLLGFRACQLQVKHCSRGSSEFAFSHVMGQDGVALLLVNLHGPLVRAFRSEGDGARPVVFLLVMSLLEFFS